MSASITRYLSPLALFAAVLCMAAPAGAALVISKDKSFNVSCSAGICNATAATAVLNAKDLAKMLATSNVEVFAEGAATEITVTAPFRWASASRLTLGAYGSINVKAAITAAGPGNLTIAANVADQDGAFRLVGVGKITFWDDGSSLIINGQTYTLVSDLASLISAIAADPSGRYAFARDYNAQQDGSFPHAVIQTPFTGTFEGLGNAIDNLTIFSAGDSASNALFLEVADKGQLSDVNLTNISFQTYGTVAALAVTNNGTITHASATGTITPQNFNQYGAGLVVYNNATLTRSHAAIDVTAAETAGGLVQNTGTISLSDASGSVAGGLAGGLVAESSGDITDSFATGNVHASRTGGGLAARSGSSTILRCFATGNVTLNQTAPARNPGERSGMFLQEPPKLAGVSAGGLVGLLEGTVIDSYALGAVTAINPLGHKHGSAGGLIGTTGSNGFVMRSYSIGAVDLNSRKYLGGSIGFEGSPEGRNTKVYWDFDTSGINDPGQGAGNIYNEKGLKGFKDTQFRRAVLRNFGSSAWAEDRGINNGYPYLVTNPPPPPGAPRRAASR